MSSPALSDLQLGVREVRALRTFPPYVPRRLGRHSREEAEIAHRRACVVLLSSHYERYIYALNESAIDFLNASAVASAKVPVEVRLLQIRGAIDRVASTEWTKREAALTNLFEKYSTHWSTTDLICQLEATPVLEWMKSPKVSMVKRYFRYFGVQDVIADVTRSVATRRAMERRLQALVDARNGIAHGDQTIQPAATDVTEYLNAVDEFCERADRLMARRLTAITGVAVPW